MSVKTVHIGSSPGGKDANQFIFHPVSVNSVFYSALSSRRRRRRDLFVSILVSVDSEFKASSPVNDFNHRNIFLSLAAVHSVFKDIIARNEAISSYLRFDPYCSVQLNTGYRNLDVFF